ncbi:MAG: SpoIIE family protein phosphatase [Bacteroidia bacterium]|nr:SpoIIE family protein phosphatase [Bacteroidia bacterium]
MENEEIIFAPEPACTVSKETWKILIVDDDTDVHTITKIALEDFIYKNRKIKCISAYTAHEAEKKLVAEPDIAVVLLDVVMETVHAGLDLVKIIREKHRNSIVRIILRTGQPGEAPEKDVIKAYEIDDYKAKLELTNVRLFTVILASVRAYETLKKLDDYGKRLEQKVAERTKEITDSIHYASYLQKAIFPPAELLTEIFPQHFIIFRPRNIVSGDFYWFLKQDNKIFFAVADCTGHGVPGAIMSMLGIAFINEIVMNNRYIPAHEILNELRKNVIKSLHQKGHAGDTRDGMDIAMCIYENEYKKLQFAGANNGFILIRENELIQKKGNKMPVGFYELMNPFQCDELVLKYGDSLYFYTDGITDQLGGNHGKKFMSKRFKELLLAVSVKPLQEQKIILEQTYENWKGNNEQTDDVTVLGIKIVS